MYDELEEIARRPEPFGVYTAKALWADPHRAAQMLAYHLKEDVDLSSRTREFVDLSAAWIIDRFGLGPGRSLCDFGCGPGLYTSRLARSGARVTGLDFSANSLRYARQKAAEAGQAIDYIEVNYLDFVPTDPVDLITMIMCDYCALSPAQRAGLLKTFHDSLTDDGAILLDVYSMAGFAAREETSIYEKNQLAHFWSAAEYYCFVNTFKYEGEAVVLDKYSIFEEGGGRETVYNWLQYFSPESLTEELSAAGFTVAEMLGDVAGRPFDASSPEFAVIATKA